MTTRRQIGLLPSRATTFTREPDSQELRDMLMEAVQRLIAPGLPPRRDASLPPIATSGGNGPRCSPFQSEEAAYRFVEQCVWPDMPVCPHCGARGHAGRLTGNSTRVGTWKCYECRKPFSVKVGTFLESSHLPMCKWLRAILLVYSAGRPIDANSLGRALKVAPRTAAYVLQRLRSPRSTHQNDLAPVAVRQVRPGVGGSSPASLTWSAR
jgi:transposase-like protein